MDTRDEAGVALDEPLRPPESWPGAGGLKSVAPEVPSWPSGPIRMPGGTACAVNDQPEPAAATPGEGWPGMTGSQPVTKKSAASGEATEGDSSADAGPASEERRNRRTDRGEKNASTSQGVSPRTLGGALFLLVACVLIAAWVVVDPTNRVLQLVVLGVVFVVGGIFIALAMRRQ